MAPPDACPRCPSGQDYSGTQSEKVDMAADIGAPTEDSVSVETGWREGGMEVELEA